MLPLLLALSMPPADLEGTWTFSYTHPQNNTGYATTYNVVLHRLREGAYSLDAGPEVRRSTFVRRDQGLLREHFHHHPRGMLEWLWNPMDGCYQARDDDGWVYRLVPHRKP